MCVHSSKKNETKSNRLKPYVAGVAGVVVRVTSTVSVTVGFLVRCFLVSAISAFFPSFPKHSPFRNLRNLNFAFVVTCCAPFVAALYCGVFENKKKHLGITVPPPFLLGSAINVPTPCL